MNILVVYDSLYGNTEKLPMQLPKVSETALKIAAILQSKGGNAVAEPEGFIVEGKTGPLQDGEIARATVWAKRMIKPSR